MPDQFSSGTITQADAAFYVAHDSAGGAYLRGTFRVGEYRIDRVALGRMTTGRYNATTAGGKLEFGVKTTFGFKPFVTARLDRQFRQGVAEDDPTFGNTDRSERSDSRQVEVGLVFRRDGIVLPPGVVVSAHGRASLSWEFAAGSDVTAALTSASDFGFSTMGLSRDRDEARIEVGMTAQLEKSISFDLGFAAALRGGRPVGWGC